MARATATSSSIRAIASRTVAHRHHVQQDRPHREVHVRRREPFRRHPGRVQRRRCREDQGCGSRPVAVRVGSSQRSRAAARSTRTAPARSAQQVVDDRTPRRRPRSSRRHLRRVRGTRSASACHPAHGEHSRSPPTSFGQSHEGCSPPPTPAITSDHHHAAPPCGRGTVSTITCAEPHMAMSPKNRNTIGSPSPDRRRAAGRPSTAARQARRASRPPGSGPASWRAPVRVRRPPRVRGRRVRP